MNRHIESLEEIEKRLTLYPDSYPPEPLLRNKKKRYRGAHLLGRFEIIYYHSPFVLQDVFFKIYFHIFLFFFHISKIFPIFFASEEDTFARKNKINDYFFGSLLAYSYLCIQVLARM